MEWWPAESGAPGTARLDPPQRPLAASQQFLGSSNAEDTARASVPRDADGDLPRSRRSIPAPMLPQGSSAGGAGDTGGVGASHSREGASQRPWQSCDFRAADDTGRQSQGGPLGAPTAADTARQQLRQRQGAAAYAEPSRCGVGGQDHGLQTNSEAYAEAAQAADTLAAQNRLLRAALESVHQARATASAAVEDGEARIQVRNGHTMRCIGGRH